MSVNLTALRGQVLSALPGLALLPFALHPAPSPY
jgi:hypothetical protein